MRIIAGSARGLPLRVPKGTAVRPTSGRVRTSLFSILAGRLEGARVLDLFAGCGSLGIEALSRGAAFCCFVEQGRGALEALTDNLARARLADRAEILRADALAILPILEGFPPFDLVLLDPPYRLAREQGQRFLTFLEQLGAGRLLVPDAIVVIQHDSRTALPSSVGWLRLAERRTYGVTTVTFFLSPPRRPGSA
jgi:16S rRNA (guanine(966)-N(2))-methyltransferase RsmD